MASVEAVKQPANPPTESKSARKKKAKAEAAASTTSAKLPDTPQEASGPDQGLDGADTSGDSPYIKELQK